MVYVNEILKVRQTDNEIDRKRLLESINMLQQDLLISTDQSAREGITEALKDIYYEYKALGQENREIKAVLSMIQSRQPKKCKKKRASSLATGRLSSETYSNSLTSS